MEVRAPTWQSAYRALRDGTALLALEGSAIVEVTGGERVGYVHDLVTNDIAGLEPGQGARAMMLTPTKGRVVADFLVCSTPAALWIECFGGSSPIVSELLQKFYFGQDVAFNEHGEALTVLSLQGPKSGEILENVGGPAPTATAAISGSKIADTDLRVVRWSDTGEVGFHLWVPSEAVADVTATLTGAGVVEGSAQAWEVAQIEAGIAVFGRELTADVIPLEAPTENAISHTKGCYPGQEVIARLWARGRPAKHLRGLRFLGETTPGPGSELAAADKPRVARVTASATSPEMGPIGLAYVHRDYCEPGTRLVGEAGEAEVAALPMREVAA